MMIKYILILGLLTTVMFQSTLGNDPDLTTAFNVTNPVVGDFTSTAFRNLQSLSKGSAKPFLATIPGLSGLAVTPVLFEFGAQSQIDPHTHPRATEMFFVLSGALDVGLVDTSNNLFETTVQKGDIFVFLKGMLHWIRNNGQGTASSFSSLSSDNPDSLFIAKALFTAGDNGIPDVVLATALGTSDSEIMNLQQPIAFRNNVTHNDQAPSPHGL